MGLELLKKPAVFFFKVAPAQRHKGVRFSVRSQVLHVDEQQCSLSGLERYFSTESHFSNQVPKAANVSLTYQPAKGATVASETLPATASLIASPRILTA